MGFTPPSRYSFIVSDDCARRLSGSFLPLYFSCIAFMRGDSPCSLRIWRVWRIVSGIISTRTITVKTMIASPKLLKSNQYNPARLLIIGRIMP